MLGLGNLDLGKSSVIRMINSLMADEPDGALGPGSFVSMGAKPLSTC